jgi:hypothetical protein
MDTVDAIIQYLETQKIAVLRCDWNVSERIKHDPFQVKVVSTQKAVNALRRASAQLSYAMGEARTRFAKRSFAAGSEEALTLQRANELQVIHPKPGESLRRFFFKVTPIVTLERQSDELVEAWLQRISAAPVGAQRDAVSQQLDQLKDREWQKLASKLVECDQVRRQAGATVRLAEQHYARRLAHTVQRNGTTVALEDFPPALFCFVFINSA